jgi:hypothetical protein
MRRDLSTLKTRWLANGWSCSRSLRRRPLASLYRSIMCGEDRGHGSFPKGWSLMMYLPSTCSSCWLSRQCCGSASAISYYPSRRLAAAIGPYLRNRSGGLQRGSRDRQLLGRLGVDHCCSNFAIFSERCVEFKREIVGFSANLDFGPAYQHSYPRKSGETARCLVFRMIRQGDR